MSEWIFLNDKPPFRDDSVLGCDWYVDGSDDSNFRIAVCEGIAQDGYWCGEKSGEKVLPVCNSICPMIGHGESAYWMPIPEKDDSRWVKFDIDKPPYWEELHEVLMSLHNGNHYIGFIESFDWCPSFNMMRHGSLEVIDCWMELPEKPEFVPPKTFTAEELEEREKKSEEWLKKFNED